MILSGGGQLTLRQHLLSRDGLLLLVCAANSIKVYSAVTGEQLFTLQGHTDEVTCLALHPANPFQVYSGSKDGTLAAWDLQDGTQLHSWPVIGEPVESLVVVGRSAFVTCQWREAQAGRVLEFSLARGVPEPPRGKVSKPRALAAASNSPLLATHDRHTVLVWDAHRFGTSRPLALHHTKAITCVALSPDGSKIAAGDATGRIIIWHNVAEAVAAMASPSLADPATALDTGAEAAAAPAEPPAATVHWHAQAVGCLTWSSDGAYLLSGGQEAVLVMWDAGSGRKAYLPRLGGALAGIVGCPGDGAKYALRQSDNTLRMVNAALMRVECSVHGLRPAPRSHHAPAAFQPGTGLLILAGPHATLQWYDVTRDAHADKLALSQRNVVSLTEADAAALGGIYGPPAEPAATAVALNADGSALATVETRPDPAGGGAVQHSLKFWDRLEGAEAQYGAPYRVNTVADQPHRSSAGCAGVTSLAFHPTQDLAATTSEAGEFKIWSRQRLRVLASASPDPTNAQPTAAAGAGAGKRAGDGGTMGRKEEMSSTWRCAAVGGYRSEPLTASAFSADGSVLALGGADGGISLWDAKQTALLGVLPSALTAAHAPSLGEGGDGAAGGRAVRQLLFLSRCPLLVAVTGSGVAVYDLLTRRCQWAAEVALGAAAADPASPHWAAVVRESSSTGRAAAAAQQQRGEGPVREQGVVAFKGAGREPVAAWQLRRAASAANPGGAATLAFALPGTPLHAAAADASLPGMSPLLVLTADREYSVARREGAPAVTPAAGKAGASTGGLAAKRRDTFAPSAFEAMYGQPAAAPADAAVAGVPVAVGVVGGGMGGRPAWAALFDAPSHALPPLGTLCPAFLNLVVAGDGGSVEDS